MSDLVERLRKPITATFQPGVPPVVSIAEEANRQRSEAASRISQQDAELERAKAEARKAAFIEAAEKARKWAQHYPHSSDGRNTFILFAEWAERQGALVEETRT